MIPDVLVRTKRTPPLRNFDLDQRREVLRNAVVVNQWRKSAIAGRNIVLVDDVLTSGATTDACVRAMKDAGAATVVIACYARVLNNKAKGVE